MRPQVEPNEAHLGFLHLNIFAYSVKIGRLAWDEILSSEKTNLYFPWSSSRTHKRSNQFQPIESIPQAYIQVHQSSG